MTFVAVLGPTEFQHEFIISRLLNKSFAFTGEA
jgi:hypothetical protein